MVGSTREKLTCEAVARAALGQPLSREGAELLYRCIHPERHQSGDAHPSLKINPKKDTWACFVCNVSGTAWALAAFFAGRDPGDRPGVSAWLRERGLLNGKRPKVSHVGREPVAFYEYRNASGNSMARKLRFEPGTDGRLKSFEWQRWENGAWVDGLAGIKPPLYRLPEIQDEPRIVLTEGEKDADAGAKIGLPTTTSGGTGSFREDHAEALRGKDVWIVSDADPPGRAEAQKRAAMLFGKAASVKVCEIPGSKDLAEAIEKGVPLKVLLALFEDTTEWKPATGAEILDPAFRFIRRFVSLTDSQARVVVLWVAHTHAISAADFTPYMNVTSAEKESGKSRLLEVVAVLVANAWKTENASPAAIVRKVHAGLEAGEPVTILFDERDSQLGGDKERAETIRGILNSGYERGGSYSRCVGEKMSVVDFGTFGAKALAGIGTLSDTVASRSIPIRLKRARRGKVKRFRRRDVEREAAEIKGKLASWCQVNAEKLRDAQPEIPEQLSDRQADCCEPLLAIADIAGCDWPETGRWALAELCAQGRAEDDSIGVKLLGDIKRILSPHDEDGPPLPPQDRIASSDLAEALGKMEDRPWSEWGRSQKPMTPPQVARLLGKYGICPHTVRLPDERRLKGYEREQFAEAWELYLPPDSAQVPSTLDPKRDAVTTRENTGENEDLQSVTISPCHGSQNSVSANENGPCHVVTAPNGSGGTDSLLCSRCGNREQNLAAARYHYKKLCPKLRLEG